MASEVPPGEVSRPSLTLEPWARVPMPGKEVPTTSVYEIQQRSWMREMEARGSHRRSFKRVRTDLLGDRLSL